MTSFRLARWQISRGAAYGIVFLFAVMVALAAANLMITAREISGLRNAVHAQCQFDADIGAAPISAPPGMKRPSVLGVSIVADARQAWRGLDCPGKLAPPGPDFARWARYYHLPAN